MRRRIVAVALGLAAGAAAPALAQHPHGPPATGPAIPATITYDAVVPDHLDVVAGETVRWTNESARVHTVTADDESFDSGRMPVGGVFSRRFDAAGTFAYHCVLHPFVRGVVAVHPILLVRPRHAAAPGRAFPLTGRAAVTPGTAVTIEADHGQGFAAVASTNVETDGTFEATVVPRTTTTLRAVTDGYASPPVPLLVLDRRVGVSSQTGRRRHLLRTTVAPAAPGAHVVLQLHLRERFGWWPVQRGRLDSRSRARFALRTRRKVAARVVLTLPDGATPLAVSRTVRLGPRF